MSVALRWIPGDGPRPAAKRHARAQVGGERERHDRQERVERDPAIDVEPGRGGVDLGASADLAGVRGHRQVGLQGDSRIVAATEGDRQAAESGEPRRRRVVGIQAAHGRDEILVSPPAEARRHVAGDRPRDHPRVTERGIDRQQLGAEIDDPHEVDVEIDDPPVLGRERDGQASEHEETDRLGHLQHEPELGPEQDRRAPGDLEHGAEDVSPVRRRKKARRSLTICGALRMGSFGNITRSTPPVLSAARKASTTIVRLMPASPPTPVRANPKPSWIGGSSTTMTIRNENPGVPSGSRVSRSPMAVTEML